MNADHWPIVGRAVVLAAGIAHSFVTVLAEETTIRFEGTVRLSEISEYPNDEAVYGSISYDSEAQGDERVTRSGDITETTYSGISIRFRNAGGSLEIDTKDAKIIIIRNRQQSTYQIPYHELRLFIPKESVERNPDVFYGYVSFSDRSLTMLADGKLPSEINLNHFRNARFLFEWGRGDAPNAYSGRITNTSDTPPRILEIDPTGILKFHTRRDDEYQIEYSDDLKSWALLDETIVGTGFEVVRPIAMRQSRGRHFRLIHRRP